MFELIDDYLAPDAGEGAGQISKCPSCQESNRVYIHVHQPRRLVLHFSPNGYVMNEEAWDEFGIRVIRHGPPRCEACSDVRMDLIVVQEEEGGVDARYLTVYRAFSVQMDAVGDADTEE